MVVLNGSEVGDTEVNTTASRYSECKKLSGNIIYYILYSLYWPSVMEGSRVFIATLLEGAGVEYCISFLVLGNKTGTSMLE